MSRSRRRSHAKIIIEIDKKGFLCSRELISRYSRHLMDVVYSEEPPDSIGFGDITPKDFHEYQNWIEKGRRFRCLTLDNIANLISFSVAFECDSLRDQCKRFVNYHSGKIILYEILELVRFPGREGVMSFYVHENFDLFRYATDMMKLELKSLTALFLNDNLITSSEQNVVDTGIRWLTFVFKSLIDDKKRDNDSDSISTISNVSEYFEEMSDQQTDSEKVERKACQSKPSMRVTRSRRPGLRSGDSGLQTTDGSIEAGSRNESDSSELHSQDDQDNTEMNYQRVSGNIPANFGPHIDASEAQNDLQADSLNTLVGRHEFIDHFPEANSTDGVGDDNDNNNENDAGRQEIDFCESDGSEAESSNSNRRPRRRRRGRKMLNIERNFVSWTEDSEDDTCSSDDFEFEDEDDKQMEKQSNDLANEVTEKSNAVSSNHDQNQQGMNGEDSTGNANSGVSVKKLLEMRKKHVFEVLMATKLCHCTQDYVSSLTEMLIIRTCPDAWALVQEAVRYFILKDRRHDYVPVTALARRNSRLQNMTVSVHKGPPLALLLTDYVKKESYRVPSPFETNNAEFRLVCYNDVVYITGASRSRRLWKYDSRSGRWSECSTMRVPRLKHALVCHGGYLYAIGGDVMLTVERFPVDQDNSGHSRSPVHWELVGTLKRTLKRIVTATVLSDFILVFGKVAGFPQYTCVQFFSTETKTVVRRHKFFVPAKGLISFRKTDQVYILERSGAAWRLFLNEKAEPCFKFVCNLWKKKKIHLKGAFFVGKSLHVFVGLKYLASAPKIDLQRIEGFCEDVSLSFHTSEFHTPLLMEKKFLEKKRRVWEKEEVIVSFDREEV